MSRKGTVDHKHLTDRDREYIAEALMRGMTMKEIGRYLHKDPSTISKEIKKRRIFQEASHFNDSRHNTCKLRFGCQKKNICQTKSCKYPCRKCANCNSVCPDFVEDACKTLLRAPFVCNGCPKKTACRLGKYYYRPSTAHLEYRELLVTSRAGVNLTEQQLVDLDELVTPLIKRGQSPAHILATHKHEIPCSERSLYRYIQNCTLSARNIDLPRKVRYKPRRKPVNVKPTHYAVRQNRTYDDFLRFITENPALSVVEMDTVEGRPGGKCILTFFFRSCRLQLAFLLPDQTQDSVYMAVAQLRNQLGYELWRQLFAVILTDNGSEFLDPRRLEQFDGKQSCRIFFCNPNSAWQKGALEKNHEHIRSVLPKGSSFDCLAQHHIQLIVDHVNAYCRDSLQGKSPYAVAAFLLPHNALSSLGCSAIPPDDVLLTPALIR